MYNNLKILLISKAANCFLCQLEGWPTCHMQMIKKFSLAQYFNKIADNISPIVFSGMSPSLISSMDSRTAASNPSFLFAISYTFSSTVPFVTSLMENIIRKQSAQLLKKNKNRRFSIPLFLPGKIELSVQLWMLMGVKGERTNTYIWLQALFDQFDDNDLLPVYQSVD